MWPAPQKRWRPQGLVFLTRDNYWSQWLGRAPLCPKESCPGIPCCLWAVPPGRLGAQSGACRHLLHEQLCFVWHLLYMAFPQLLKGSKFGWGEPVSLTCLEKRLYYLPWWSSSVTDTLKGWIILSCPQEQQEGMLPVSCHATGEQRDPRGSTPCPQDAPKGRVGE